MTGERPLCAFDRCRRVIYMCEGCLEKAMQEAGVHHWSVSFVDCDVRATKELCDIFYHGADLDSSIAWDEVDVTRMQ